MRTVTNKEVKTKLVEFEPGNCSRYYLLLTEISENFVIMTDVNSRIVTVFGTKWLDEQDLAFRLRSEGGYFTADAEAMAKFIVEEISSWK